MELFRCPICLLTPRIINVEYKFKLFTFRFLWPNNHKEIIYSKQFKKYYLRTIKYNKYNDINNKSEYFVKNVLISYLIDVKNSSRNMIFYLV